mmetsp:Transcript_37206/g.86792  ORF Transcript_37206/g.86792 Transcript_37206/m.86792 type:complete len:223 (-) Transcript_37206:2243-2911(-)
MSKPASKKVTEEDDSVISSTSESDDEFSVDSERDGEFSLDSELEDSNYRVTVKSRILHPHSISPRSSSPSNKNARDKKRSKRSAKIRYNLPGATVGRFRSSSKTTVTTVPAPTASYNETDPKGKVSTRPRRAASSVAAERISGSYDEVWLEERSIDRGSGGGDTVGRMSSSDDDDDTDSSIRRAGASTSRRSPCGKGEGKGSGGRFSKDRTNIERRSQYRRR